MDSDGACKIWKLAARFARSSPRNVFRPLSEGWSLLPFFSCSGLTNLSSKLVALVNMPSSLDIDTKQDLSVDGAGNPQGIAPAGVSIPSRPVIEYHSPTAFFSSVGKRFASIWTRRFILSLVAGQVVSFCIMATNVCTTELVMRNWALPTTQTFFLWVYCLRGLSISYIIYRYFSLFCVYTPYTIYQCTWHYHFWKYLHQIIGT